MRPLALALALLLLCAGAAGQSDDEERLPGWLGEVGRGNAGGTPKLLRGGGAVSAAAGKHGKKRRDKAAATESQVVRLPEDGIPVPGTVHPDVRAPLACNSKTLALTSRTRLVRAARRSRRRWSSSPGRRVRICTGTS